MAAALLAGIAASGCAEAGSPDYQINGNGADAGQKDGGQIVEGSGTLGSQMPQVVDVPPGIVMTAPMVIPITWDNDTNRTDIEAFVADYAHSSAWQTQTAEYGVGALTVGAPIHLSGNAPTSYTDSDITNLLETNLSGTNPAWGAPSSNTIYAFYFPAGTTVNDGDGDLSCEDWDGYHSDDQIGSTYIAYAVTVQCATGEDGPGITQLQQLTIAAAHEMVESATDPFYDYTPGWAETDAPHGGWEYATDGEVADMCEFADTLAWQPPDMTYTIQRIWSNKIAAEGTDPCVGQPTTPYYQTIPEQPDQITLEDLEHTNGSAWVTSAFTATPGQTVEIPMTLYANPSGGTYTVSIDDYNSVYNGGSTLITATVPAARLQNGDQVVATIKLSAYDPYLGNAAAFVVNTTPIDETGPTTYYFALVGSN